MKLDLIYYISGTVISIYFLLIWLAGIIILCISKRNNNKIKLGVPIFVLTMHLALLGFILGGCVAMSKYIFIGAGIIYLLKIIITNITLYEIRALKNVKNVE